MTVLLAAPVSQVLAAANSSRSLGRRENCYARNVRGFSGFLYIFTTYVFLPSLPLSPPREETAANTKTGNTSGEHIICEIYV
jgi:hypothetical protein